MKFHDESLQLGAGAAIAPMADMPALPLTGALAAPLADAQVEPLPPDTNYGGIIALMIVALCILAASMIFVVITHSLKLTFAFVFFAGAVALVCLGIRMIAKQAKRKKG